MKYFRIALREDNPGVTLDAYLSDLPEPVRDAVLVIPGGGYECVCTDREGEPIALAYLAAGYNAFVLRYSIGWQAKFPRPLADASLAMMHIRRHAKEYCLHSDRIFVAGFSAGGHLAGSLGTLWNLPELKQEIPDLEEGENKPAGMILCYPVISGGEFAHIGSFQNLLGKEHPTAEELDRYSLEKCVDAKTTVPAFLLHTANDACVPVENTLLMASALSAAKVPFEVHIYPSAPHGCALGNQVTAAEMKEWNDPAIGQWVQHSILWMNRIK